VCAIVLALPVAARAEPGTPCAQSTAIVGRCFTVHGRMSFWNGNPPVRIHPTGSRRMLGVLDGAKSDASSAVLPADLRRQLGPEWDTNTVYGEFELCPLTKQRPGWMQFVCLRQVHNFTLIPEKKP
jgi:hypothetical protein